jgi:hypothetical protein
MQQVPMARAEWGTFTIRSLMRGECANLTSLTLSCTARARVPYKTRGAAAAAVRVSIRADAICSRRDAAQILFGRAASAADRSRAVTASAWS